jgi:chemotaxis protein MotB
MMKFGAGLLAILAGMLGGPATAAPPDKAPVIERNEITTSLESEVAMKNFAAGFIRPSFPYEARISPITGDNEMTGNKRLIGSGEQIYLELTNPQDVAPGDRFILYRQVKKVYHPVRGDYLGDLTSVLGTVKVLRVTGSKATVRVERAYEGIFSGDGAMRQRPAEPAPASLNQPPPEGTGMIVELPPGQTLIGQHHSVYIDWGRNDGIRIGDRLQVFRESSGLPLQIIGELQVIAVEDRTATARIIQAAVPFIRRDRFASKATLQRQLGIEPPPTMQSRKEALFQETTPASAAATSAPVATEMSQEAHAAPRSRDIERELAELARQLEFDPGNAPVTDASLPVLDKIKTLLKEAPDSRIVIEGHTDSQSIGPSLRDQYASNRELSRARASAVADYLVKEGGTNPRNISVVGYADAKPVASNGSEAGRKRNRRIAITLLPGEQPSAPTTPKGPAPEPRDMPTPAPEPAPPTAAPSAP